MGAMSCWVGPNKEELTMQGLLSSSSALLTTQ
jgi:hypothetical protein